MKFLKTFFGEVLRKNDIDFESQAVWLFKIKPISDSSLHSELDQLMSLENYIATSGS